MEIKACAIIFIRIFGQNKKTQVLVKLKFIKSMKQMQIRKIVNESLLLSIDLKLVQQREHIKNTSIATIGIEILIKQDKTFDTRQGLLLLN